MDEFIPHLSIVIPLFNAAPTLPALYQELSGLEIPGGLELILVNDGSRDETEEIVLKLTRTSRIPITLLSLSRNFGEHNAVMAGLRASRGHGHQTRGKVRAGRWGCVRNCRNSSRLNRVCSLRFRSRAWRLRPRSCGPVAGGPARFAPARP